jgi:cytochrome P450
MRPLPGPRGLPLLGSLVPFYRGRQLWFLQQVTRRYGDLCGFQVLRQRFALVNDPEHAAGVLANRDGAFRQAAPQELRVVELMKAPAKGLVRRTGSAPSPGGRDREQLEAAAHELTRRQVAPWLQQGGVDVVVGAGALATWLAFATFWEVELDEPTEVFLALREALSEGALDKKVPKAVLEARRERFRALKERLLAGQPEDEHAAARRKGFSPMALATVSPLSAALAWCLVYLADAPERASGVSADAGYRRAFVQEVLRHRPPAWVLGRTSVREVDMGGFRIHPKTRVIVSPFLLHHHPAHWEEPEAFRPERFLEGKPASAFYMPFGTGQKSCPASAAAMTLLEGATRALAEVRCSFEGRPLPAPSPSYALLPEGTPRLSLRAG